MRITTREVLDREAVEERRNRPRIPPPSAGAAVGSSPTARRTVKGALSATSLRPGTGRQPTTPTSGGWSREG